MNKQMLNDFYGLSLEDKQTVLDNASPAIKPMLNDFHGLPQEEQQKVLANITEPAVTPPTTKELKQKGLLRDISERALGGVEATASFLGGIPAFLIGEPIKGWAGISRGVTEGLKGRNVLKGIEKGIKEAEPLVNRLTVYQPKTEAGQRSLAEIQDIYETTIGTPSEYAGEVVQKRTEPIYGRTIGAIKGAASQILLETLANILMFKGGEGLIRKGAGITKKLPPQRLTRKEMIEATPPPVEQKLLTEAPIELTDIVKPYTVTPEGIIIPPGKAIEPSKIKRPKGMPEKINIPPQPELVRGKVPLGEQPTELTDIIQTPESKLSSTEVRDQIINRLSGRGLMKRESIQPLLEKIYGGREPLILDEFGKPLNIEELANRPNIPKETMPPTELPADITMTKEAPIVTQEGFVGAIAKQPPKFTIGDIVIRTSTGKQYKVFDKPYTDAEGNWFYPLEKGGEVIETALKPIIKSETKIEKPPITFKNFVESKGIEWPINTDNPQYPALLKEFQSLQKAIPEITPAEPLPKGSPLTENLNDLVNTKTIPIWREISRLKEGKNEIETKKFDLLRKQLNNETGQSLIHYSDKDLYDFSKTIKNIKEFQRELPPIPTELVDKNPLIFKHEDITFLTVDNILGGGKIKDIRFLDGEDWKFLESKRGLGVFPKNSLDRIVENIKSQKPKEMPITEEIKPEIVLTNKEQKKFLINEIGKAIENAPEEVEIITKKVPSVEYTKHGGKKPVTVDRPDFTQTPSVTINVPDDGIFTVINSKKSLQEFKNKVESRFPVTEAKPEVKGEYTLPKPTGKRISGEDIEYYNEFKPRKEEPLIKPPKDNPIHYNDGFYTDGFYAIKTEKPTGIKFEKTPTTLSINRVIDAQKDYQNAKIVGEFADRGNVYAHIVGDNGVETIIPAKHADAFLTKYPNAIIKISKKGETDSVRFEDNGKPVGLAMPMRDFELPEQYRARFEEIKGEKGIEEELRNRVDETIGNVTPPIGMSIKTVGIQGKQNAANFKFTEPEIETRWKQSQGIKKVSLYESGKEALKDLWHKVSRGAYEYLPRIGEFAQLRFDLLRLAKGKGIAIDKTLRDIQGITINFRVPDRNLFDRKIILDDLVETAKEGKSLPFGFTKDNITKELNRLNIEVAKYPEIQKAIELRKRLWDSIRQDEISAMKNIGVDISERMTNPNYFRHQVLDRINAEGLFGTGRKLKTPTNRGYLRERKGSELDINSDYIQAETEVMARMLYDTELAKIIKRVEDGYSITNKVKADAKKQGLIDWHEAIPKGYTTWQPREGNIFYMADTIPAKLADILTKGDLEELGITANDLGKALAKGGRYREFVVKEEVAKTLDNLIRNKDVSRIIDIDKKLLTAWKQWQLVSPRRFPKYNARNLTGDADGAFLGNTSGFKKTPQAFKELYATFFGDKSMTPDMKDWFERGGMQSTLQAQEMGEVGKLKMFQQQYETKVGIKDVPIKLWQKYWKSVRLTTDFRESILRYANYLDYIRQMRKNPKGIPDNFGASIREEVMALPDIKDRAFKLQNELLGAYDDISVMGQALREHLFPFFSWKEINMKRYYRIYKNAAYDEQIANIVGKHILKGVATTPYKVYKIGKFAIKATALLSALRIWNNMMFPTEENELTERQKAIPHILFGRDKDGKILSFDRIGALGDLLDWVGLNEAPQNIDKWFKGKMTLTEVAKEMAKTPINVLVQGATPFFKIPAELLSKRTLFPDFSRPKRIRDNGLYIAKSLGMGDEYKAISGLPSRPYYDSISKAFIYKTDPYEAAYNDILEEKNRFLKKLGKGGESYWSSPRSDALYNFKLALRYEDKIAAKKYLREYLSYGGDETGLAKSLGNINPLAGLNEDEQQFFVMQLDDEGKKELTKALIFYDRVLLGKDRLQGNEEE